LSNAVQLLDDNRELRIPETQQVVQAKDEFVLFATQNPPGHYGGRKVSSFVILTPCVLHLVMFVNRKAICDVLLAKPYCSRTVKHDPVIEDVAKLVSFF
jgi:hypothetical protein